jgi:hypothetical protein
MDDKLGWKKLQKFCCTNCDFVSSEQWRLNRHLSTGKHQKETNGGQNQGGKSCTPYLCKCGREYKFRQGLWKHQKICSNCIIDEDKEQIILMLVKQNSELIKETTEFKTLMMEQQNIMMEVIKNGTQHNTINTIK